MVVPHSLSDRTALRGGNGVFHRSGGLLRQLYRLTRPCCLKAAIPVRTPKLPPHRLTERPRSACSGHALNATPNSKAAPVDPTATPYLHPAPAAILALLGAFEN